MSSVEIHQLQGIVRMIKNIYLVILFTAGCGILYLGFTQGSQDEQKFKEIIQGKRTFSSLLTSPTSKAENQSKLTYLAQEYNNDIAEPCQQLMGTLNLMFREIPPKIDQPELVSNQIQHFNLSKEENKLIDSHFLYYKSRFKGKQSSRDWKLYLILPSEDEKLCTESLVTASNILYSRINGLNLADMSNYLGHSNLIYNTEENTLQAYRFIFIFNDFNKLFDYSYTSTDNMRLAYRETINY